MAKAAKPERPTIAGIGISHPERLIYPDQSITKIQLGRYYEAVADWMVPHLVGRPLTMLHCPHGLAAPMKPNTPTCHCSDGWVCEDHPDKAMNHHRCGGARCDGAGMPCENPECPHGRRALKRKAVDEAINRERYPDWFPGD